MKKAGHDRIRIGIDAGTLRLLAILFMLLDHVWATFLSGNLWMTCLGRLAFPIFVGNQFLGMSPFPVRRRINRQVPYEIRIRMSPPMNFRKPIQFNAAKTIRFRMPRPAVRPDRQKVQGHVRMSSIRICAEIDDSPKRICRLAIDKELGRTVQFSDNALNRPLKLRIRCNATKFHGPRRIRQRTILAVSAKPRNVQPEFISPCIEIQRESHLE